jgi:hypothetical protein
VSGAKTGTVQAAGATFLLTAPGVVSVTMGATADSLKFAGMSTITFTGSTAATSVLADGGTNSFKEGKGALTVTGGSGADAYGYHLGDGMLVIKDFALAKGDSLTVDKTLQASLTEKADGLGGTFVGFGTLAKGVDLIGVPSLATSQIHFV